MADNRYYRCRQDKSGCEPKRLFTLAEFMIYDKDGSGTVNEDECMEMMCAVPHGQ
jgi:calmodulin